MLLVSQFYNLYSCTCFTEVIIPFFDSEYNALDFRMQRNKGQFTSSKSKPEDAMQNVTAWDATQRGGAVDGRAQAASE